VSSLQSLMQSDLGNVYGTGFYDPTICEFHLVLTNE
jgi:hypothetical protein